MKMKSLLAGAMLAASVLAVGMPAEAGHLEDITARGTLKVGTTGDYKPMSYLNKETGEYEGIDAALAEAIAASMGVKVEYVPTTWKTLTADTQAEKFDIAICGITRTPLRERIMAMSDGYAANGKTILCRKKDAKKFKSLADIDKADVRVMHNPGGTNEKFAQANIKNAQILVHEKNAEIPQLVADGAADIMITETVEAVRYCKEIPELAAPLLDQPFTKNTFGVLMAQGDQPLLNYVNFILAEMAYDGRLEALQEEYLR